MRCESNNKAFILVLASTLTVWRLKAEVEFCALCNKKSMNFGFKSSMPPVFEREDWLLLDRVIDAPVHTGYTDLGNLEARLLVSFRVDFADTSSTP